jgi:hypothetical protein
MAPNGSGQSRCAREVPRPEDYNQRYFKLGWLHNGGNSCTRDLIYYVDEIWETYLLSRLFAKHGSG